MARGAIDTISLEALVYLLEHLPQTQAYSDWIPGALLDSSLTKRLEAEQFTGYAVFAFEENWLGGLLFYQGLALEAWRRALGGLENRAEAYRNLLPMFEFAAVRFFVLPPSLIPCVVALTMSEQLESYEASTVNLPAMLEKLAQLQFSGTVLFEHQNIAQAWFFKAGLRLLEPPLPESFAVGRLHLLHNPSQIPQDVVGLVSREANQQCLAEADLLRSKLEAVLVGHIGVNAKMVLENNQQTFSEPDPKQLEAAILSWLEDTYGLGLVKQFQEFQ